MLSPCRGNALVQKPRPKRQNGEGGPQSNVPRTAVAEKRVDAPVPERVTTVNIYYGIMKTGHKIHFGSDILYPDPGNRHEWLAISHCGHEMTTYNLDRPLPMKVKEYCRTCFRTEAWNYFEEAMLARAQEMAE